MYWTKNDKMAIYYIYIFTEIIQNGHSITDDEFDVLIEYIDELENKMSKPLTFSLLYGLVSKLNMV